VVLPASQQNSSLKFNKLCTRKFSSKSSKPTWLIDVDYKPFSDVLIYAKYARGYRAGGVNEANVGLETWQPEKVDDYEVGFKSSFHGALSGTFNVDGFWNEFSNQQSQVNINACTLATNPNCHVGNVGISGIQNIGHSRMRGVEADGSLSFGDLRLDGGYAFLDAKVISAEIPFCDPTQYNCAGAGFLMPGSRLTFSPKNRVTVTGTYTLPLDAKVGKVLVSATFTHTDSQYSTHGDDIYVAQIPYNAEILPATNLVNLNVAWNGVAGSPVDVSFFATNLTNKHYWVSVTNATGSLGGESLVLAEPRMIGGRLRVHFGS
jgi:iron complex outermembrane receptor protein